MNEARTPQDAASARRHAVRRRASRGLVASYMHELSDRHRTHRDGVTEGTERGRHPSEEEEPEMRKQQGSAIYTKLIPAREAEEVLA